MEQPDTPLRITIEYPGIKVVAEIAPHAVTQVGAVCNAISERMTALAAAVREGAAEEQLS